MMAKKSQQAIFLPPAAVRRRQPPFFPRASKNGGVNSQGRNVSEKPPLQHCAPQQVYS